MESQEFSSKKGKKCKKVIRMAASGPLFSALLATIEHEDDMNMEWSNNENKLHDVEFRKRTASGQLR
eukprot:m.149189 g.149189  ORF g.149189 m.149189 type:complete len:67 (+) comp16155_c0_seq1:927-1127(+)